MKLATVETFVVANPPPSFGGRYFVFVKLTTDDGIVGYGEHYGATFSPVTVAALIKEVASELLIGNDPFLIERFFRRAYGRGFTARPDVTMAGVISALEIACWDIIGKALDKPVHALLGGQVRDAVRSYTYLYGEPGDRTDVYLDPDLAARRAAEYVTQGFTAVKFDPAGPYASMGGYQPLLERIDLSVRFCRAIREAVGSKADLLFGTHGQFTAAGAIRLAKRLEPFDPLWLEEPVPPDDVAGMVQVRSHTSIPIAAGERLATKTEFARLISASAVDILQPDLGRCGGILEGKKIASIAEAHGLQIAPHCYSGPIVGAASLQLAACTPNFLILEAIRDWGGFHAELLKAPLEVEDGHTVVPSGPGLGVELNEDVARANAFTGEGLHIEMVDAPVDYRDPRWAGPQDR